jgi:hypothetical protein
VRYERGDGEERCACFKFVEVFFFFFNSFFYLLFKKKKEGFIFFHCPAVAVCKGIRQG